MDAAGSAALRTLDRATVERAVSAALLARGTSLAREELARLVPELTEPSLIDTVAQRVRDAASCLLTEHWFRVKDGVAPRPPYSPLLEHHPELPVMGLRRLVSLRAFEKHALAAAEEPESAEPRLLYIRDQPEVVDELIEDFGGLARHVIPVLWPWQRPRAAWSLDKLRAWANTGWGDGSGRYRLLWFKQPPKPSERGPRYGARGTDRCCRSAGGTGGVRGGRVLAGRAIRPDPAPGARPHRRPRAAGMALPGETAAAGAPAGREGTAPVRAEPRGN